MKQHIHKELLTADIFWRTESVFLNSVVLGISHVYIIELLRTHKYMDNTK